MAVREFERRTDGGGRIHETPTETRIREAEAAWKKRADLERVALDVATRCQGLTCAELKTVRARVMELLGAEE